MQLRTRILPKGSNIRKAKDVRRRISRRLELWNKGLIAELVQDTVATARRSLGGTLPSDDDENLIRKYHSMVIEGKLRQAVRQLTSRDGGGVLHPEDADTKMGRRVIDVLRDKHPDLMIPELERDDWESFEAYEECPDSVPVDCSEEVVVEIANKLHGGAGPSSVDALSLSKWLQRYGKASQVLREELAAWTEWLCNDTIAHLGLPIEPSWAVGLWRWTNVQECVYLG